ncbi:MAG: DUF4410 domain-containing protein [Caulobacteraceae bacterium]
MSAAALALCLVLGGLRLVGAAGARHAASAIQTPPDGRASFDAASPSAPRAFHVATPWRDIVVLPFAIAESRGAASPQSAQACPQTAVNGEMGKGYDPARARRLSDTLLQDLRKDFSSKFPVEDETRPDSLPAAAMVVSGCITQIDSGNAAERLVGLNLGASHLAAHVRILIRTPIGFAPSDEFDVEAKGGSLLPPMRPMGLVLRGAKELGDPMSADARKLARQITKRVYTLGRPGRG